MSRNAMLVLGLGAALLLVCDCGALGAIGALGAVVWSAVDTSPAQVAAAADRIADFQMPPGYRPEVTIKVGASLLASYSAGDRHGQILLAQAPELANVDQAAFERLAQFVALWRDDDPQARLQVVGSRQVTLRGQTVTLVLSEGINSSRQDYRTLTGVFQGKGGVALLSVEGPVNRWNQVEVDAFLASMQ